MHLLLHNQKNQAGWEGGKRDVKQREEKENHVKKEKPVAAEKKELGGDADGSKIEFI